MDQTSPSQQQTEPQVTILNQNNRKKRGLLKIILAGIIIIIFLGILSYLYILPRQQEPIVSESPTRQQPSNFTPQQDFQYDTKKAELLLTEYIKDNLKTEFLPEKIEVKYKLVGTGKQEGTEYTFGANWSINQDFFQSNFHYAINTNRPDDIEFLIRVEDVKNITLDPLLAANLTNKYLKNIPSDTDFDCKTVNAPPTTSCETFSVEPEGKKGYGLVIGKSQPTNIAFVFSCFIPKESVYYAKTTSCLLFKEKT